MNGDVDCRGQSLIKSDESLNQVYLTHLIHTQYHDSPLSRREILGLDGCHSAGLVLLLAEQSILCLNPS